MEVHLVNNCSQVPNPAWKKEKRKQSLVRSVGAGCAVSYCRALCRNTEHLPMDRDEVTSCWRPRGSAPSSPKTCNKSIKSPGSLFWPETVANFVSSTAFITSTSVYRAKIKHCQTFRVFHLHMMAHKYWTGLYFRKKDGPECLKLHFSLL